MEWFEELGFNDNPFNPNPLKADFNLEGREKEGREILYRIASGSMLLVEGREGTGKTALLKHAIDNFKGEGKVVYIDGNKLSKRLDIADLIKKKGMVLLMDNVQSLSKKNNEKIRYFYDEDYIKSAVFTTPNYSMVNFSNALKERIGRNIIRLRNLSQSSAIKTAKDRLEDKEILPDDVLKQLYKNSVNIKDFLENCSALCRYVVEKGRDKAEKDDIKKIQKEKIIEEEDETGLCSECLENLVKAGENWRCRNCDFYCWKCGALAEEEDTSCPQCGTEIKVEKE